MLLGSICCWRGQLHDCRRHHAKMSNTLLLCNDAALTRDLAATYHEE